VIRPFTLSLLSTSGREFGSPVQGCALRLPPKAAALKIGDVSCGSGGDAVSGRSTAEDHPTAGTIEREGRDVGGALLDGMNDSGSSIHNSKRLKI